jgi:ATP adenylyltransferase
LRRIWSPWRIQYIHNPAPSGGCIFCDKAREARDPENRILYRGNLNFIIMNIYPYNPGHLLVVPFRHIGLLEDLTEAERNEHYSLVSRAVAVLRRETRTASFNIGMNLGQVAGAGIADHIHTHIVPRWNGDNNFMPVIGETRVISDSMENVYNHLQGKF